MIPLLNKNVQDLIKTFDLEVDSYYLIVTDYHFESGAITINKMKLFDSKGVFIRFVDNKKVIGYMHKYPVSFEKIEG